LLVGDLLLKGLLLTLARLLLCTKLGKLCAQSKASCD